MSLGLRPRPPDSGAGAGKEKQPRSDEATDVHSASPDPRQPRPPAAAGAAGPSSAPYSEPTFPQRSAAFRSKVFLCLTGDEMILLSNFVRKIVRTSVQLPKHEIWRREIARHLAENPPRKPLHADVLEKVVAELYKTSHKAFSRDKNDFYILAWANRLEKDTFTDEMLTTCAVRSFLHSAELALTPEERERATFYRSVWLNDRRLRQEILTNLSKDLADRNKLATARRTKAAADDGMP